MCIQYYTHDSRLLYFVWSILSIACGIISLTMITSLEYGRPGIWVYLPQSLLWCGWLQMGDTLSLPGIIYYNDSENMFIIKDLHISKLHDAKYKYTEKSVENSFFDSNHGQGGMKPKLMDPNFCYTIVNISFWGCRKQEMVQSESRMTPFSLYLRSGKYYSYMDKIQFKHLQNNKHWFGIQFRILRIIATKINWFNIHKLHTCMQTGILQHWRVLKQEMLMVPSVGCECN